MKRRKVLKRLGLGLTAGLILPQLISSCKKEDTGPEIKYSGTVGVIGAGAAGLYAADILRSKGIKVVVFEAGSELGGRIKSLRNQPGIPSISIADFPVELGAEINFGTDSIWGKIIHNLNVPTVDLATAVNHYILDNKAQDATAWNGDADFNSVENFVTNILPNYSGTGMSVKDAAFGSGVTDRGAALLNAQTGNFYGADSTLVGAGGLAEGMKLVSHDGKWLTSKANPLQDMLISRFNSVTPSVLLNHEVQQVLYGGDKATISGVTYDDKGASTPFSMDVNKVIVTVPLSVLKSGDISFSPPLPGAMTTSMTKLGMDPSMRVLIDFKKNFWGMGTGFIWGGTTCPQVFNAGVGRSSIEQTLSIMINGPKASELSVIYHSTDADKGPIPMINLMLAELDAIYAGQATLYIRRTDALDPLFIVQDWTTEKYIKGGFSYPMLDGTIADRTNLGTSVNNLYFAGEATDVSGDAGTINGALASAERVAQEVVKAITSA